MHETFVVVENRVNMSQCNSLQRNASGYESDTMSGSEHSAAGHEAEVLSNRTHASGEFEGRFQTFSELSICTHLYQQRM